MLPCNSLVALLLISFPSHLSLRSPFMLSQLSPQYQSLFGIRAQLSFFPSSRVEQGRTGIALCLPKMQTYSHDHLDFSDFSDGHVTRIDVQSLAKLHKRLSAHVRNSPSPQSMMSLRCLVKRADSSLLELSAHHLGMNELHGLIGRHRARV
jgi:hypothetical protein